jgi:hypothetical protein
LAPHPGLPSLIRSSRHTQWHCLKPPPPPPVLCPHGEQSSDKGGPEGQAWEDRGPRSREEGRQGRPTVPLSSLPPVIFLPRPEETSWPWQTPRLFLFTYGHCPRRLSQRSVLIPGSAQPGGVERKEAVGLLGLDDLIKGTRWGGGFLELTCWKP